ncbi:MAG: hypothetical protein Salg2KO_21840 [Salibacteraceae bacterium]
MQPKLIENRYPSFSNEDIALSGIKRIRIKEMDKPSSRPIYDQNIRFTYTFNDLGQLTEYEKTFPSLGGRVDTIKMGFNYRDNAVISEVLTQGKYQRKSEYSKLDSSSTKRIISTKRSGSPWEVFEIEKITRIAFDQGEARTIGGLNDQPYQRIIKEWNLDSTEMTTETWNGSRIQSRLLIRASNDSLHHFEFDDKLNATSLKIEFPRDYALDTGYWCEDGDCLKLSILLNDAGWPRAWIFMNEKTQDMEIWEFQYWFYD